MKHCDKVPHNTQKGGYETHDKYIYRKNRCRIKRAVIVRSFSPFFFPIKRLLQVKLLRQNNLSCRAGFCPRVAVYKNRQFKTL